MWNSLFINSQRKKQKTVIEQYTNAKTKTIYVYLQNSNLKCYNRTRWAITFKVLLHIWLINFIKSNFLNKEKMPVFVRSRKKQANGIFSARSKLLWHFMVLDSYAFWVVVLNHFGLFLDSNLFLKHFELFWISRNFVRCQCMSGWCSESFLLEPLEAGSDAWVNS